MRAPATALIADQTQQIGQHVFKTLKMHHGVVLLHERDGVGHGCIMQAHRIIPFDNDQRFGSFMVRRRSPVR